MSTNAKKVENKAQKDPKNSPKNSKDEIVVKNDSSDFIKWTAVLLLAVAAIVGNIYFRDYELPIVRIVAIFAIMIAALGLALITNKGKSFINLAREARMELRKVVWPTRQEATQTTLIVAAITILIALILWALDGILIRVVTWLTKLGVGA